MRTLRDNLNGLRDANSRAALMAMLRRRFLIRDDESSRRGLTDARRPGNGFGIIETAEGADGLNSHSKKTLAVHGLRPQYQTCSPKFRELKALGMNRARALNQVGKTGRPPFWPSSSRGLILLPLLLLMAGGLLAQETNAVSPEAYKKMSLTELMDLDVTSVSKQPKPYGQAPAAIQVITSEDISRSGASSLPEAMRLADNLEVAQKNSHDWAISARGFNTALGNKLLVLMDGRSVYTPLFSGVFWDVQDYLLQDIDRVEVISGPGGTLWGANAVNGVINITTKSAKDTQGLYVEGGGGTQLRDFGGIRYGGTLASNVYFRVYGKYFDRNDEVFTNGTDAADSWNMGRGGFRVDAEPSLEDTFTLQGDYYAGHEGVITGGRANVSGGNVLGRWSHVFSDRSDLSLQLYYDRTHLSDPIPAFVAGSLTLAPAGVLVDDLDTYDLDFQHHFRLADWNNIVWGLGYRFMHEADQNAPGIAFLPPTLDHHLFSGFVQDEITLRENLFLTLGTKLEHNDYTGLEVEPSARLQWNVTPRQMLWAAVSRAVRTPSRIDRDLSQPGPGAPLILLKGGSDFQSETVIAYELGYRAQMTSKLQTSLSTFYNDYDHVRSTVTNSTLDVFNLPIPFIFQNNLEGKTYGFELSANYQLLDWWRLHGGYDLLKEDIRVKPGKSDINNALNETADPQQQFSIRSSMDLPKNVSFDTGLRWVDTLHNNNGAVVGTVPSYFELDARAAWRPVKSVELSVVGQNLLHDHHPEYGFPGPTREEINRSVYAKISWQF
jgi:iron complex outermembrane receptor protein